MGLRSEVARARRPAKQIRAAALAEGASETFREVRRRPFLLRVPADPFAYECNARFASDAAHDLRDRVRNSVWRVSVRGLPEIRKVCAPIYGRFSSEDNPAEQERHGGGHAKRTRLEGRIERRLLPFFATRHVSASLRFHERLHFRMTQ